MTYEILEYVESRMRLKSKMYRREHDAIRTRSLLWGVITGAESGGYFILDVEVENAINLALYVMIDRSRWEYYHSYATSSGLCKKHSNIEKVISAISKNNTK